MPLRYGKKTLLLDRAGGFAPAALSVFFSVGDIGKRALARQEPSMRRCPLFVSLLLILLSCFARQAFALHLYCGAGMAKPVGELAEAFRQKTQTPVEVAYANAGQIQAQINTAQEGDLFIAGAEEELKPVETYVTARRALAKHVPVLAVAKGNPRHIRGIQSLGRPEIRVVLGDGKATPIGKLAESLLARSGLSGAVNVVSRGMTAPALVQALELGACDAVIVWKENVSPYLEIVADPALDAFVKTIPAASLSFSADIEGRERFLEFLSSAEARAVWKKYGYAVFE